MINKIVVSPEGALADVPDGATVMIHGFGNAGMPAALIDALGVVLHLLDRGERHASRPGYFKPRTVRTGMRWGGSSASGWQDTFSTAVKRSEAGMVTHPLTVGPALVTRTRSADAPFVLHSHQQPAGGHF